jgi:hypothetical protein
MKLRPILNVSFVFLASLFLTGCEKPITNADLAGTWTANMASQQKWIKETNNCEITLRPDGTFSASVPDYITKTFDKASGTVVVGQGAWNLEAPKPLAPMSVELEFNEVSGEHKKMTISHTLQAERNNKEIGLFFYVGEEGGERFIFERTPNRTPQK